MVDRSTPDTPSSDYEAMLPFWQMVDTMLDGAWAMRQAGETYLPKFPNEDPLDYEYRRTNAKFTNLYADVVSNLASKPFAEEVQLAQDAGDRFKALSEDIDGRGNNLHAFAKETFFAGINRAIDWILVEFTKAQPRADGQPLSLADEQKQGLRPYWVRVPATQMLAVYSDVVRGQEIYTHARMRECSSRRDGFSEIVTERIRVFNREPIFNEFDQVVDYAPATFELWEKTARVRSNSVRWQQVDGGPISIGVIPLVPFITGRRKGSSWQFVPPMQDAAEVQVKHYQAETALWSIKELTAFPMLAGNGVQPAKNTDGTLAMVPVGPRAVLYAPPVMGQTSAVMGSWAFIEPSGTSLTFLSGEVDKLEAQLRELGRQPLVASQMTVVQAGQNAQKANAAIQAWTLGLKDALEQALVLTALWLNDAAAAPSVKVFRDFALEFTDGKDQDFLLALRKAGDLSRETLWEEGQRRSILSEDFDPDEEKARLDGEAEENLQTAADMQAAMTPDGGAKPPGGPPAQKPPAQDQQAA